MRRSWRLIVAVLAVLAVSGGQTLQAAKLGKLFIKAAPSEVGGQQFANPELEDSIKDLKSRIGDFVLANEEAEADFLMVVIKRDVELKGHGSENAKTLYVTLSTAFRNYGDVFSSVMRPAVPAPPPSRAW